MRLAQSIAVALLALGGLGATALLSQASFAQSADPDDDDDDAADMDDDADLPDPDDPANVEAGGGASDPDDGDTPAMNPGSADGDDDVPGGAGSVAEDGDDDAAPGSSPVGGDAGDDNDDDDAAPGVASRDDDDENTAASVSSASDNASDNDDDDRDISDGDTPSPRPSSAIAGEQDDDETSGELPSGNGTLLEMTGGGDESEVERIAQDGKDGIETDREGFRYRRSEFVALNLDARDVVALRGKGFTILQSQRLISAGGMLHLVKGPPRLTDAEAFALLDDIADPDSLSLNHLFDSSSGELRKPANRAPSSRPACGCQIGMIDTGVASRLTAFRHVAVEQQAFNARLPVPRSHGTAVAHQFAGTLARRGRPTRILVADIFGGQRATAGSTYALVRGLDWLASRGVSVINVSLAGPRNAVVAQSVERLSRRGHIIVAAAGNDGPAAPPVFPGAYSGVIAVTAVDNRQQIYRYANRGNYVDFSAFGVSVPAINPQGEQTAATGTSFAAPMVAARLARELGRPDPAASARVIARLEREARDLGTPGRDSVFGYGLVVDSP